ncbi:iron ABC transporter substrate-binding protein [Pseudomonas coleopterorum]|jgi:iron(III) transport system substrate-binding protein|uniref:iron ABC transporter substrate-binding protein n=1 Tax=Pseudomonas TaxID=286 RepID=UPI0007035F01|nr:MULTISPECIES: iron ABC transporter substrate-binding protein [Pseudomonas]KQQ59151.1 iron ABC transporter substrate-binding protein [Pseudomonas sp. Leaf129]MDY1047811.1 iron ABC transporter substrate-binding protein [Pseudomonas coleopterorum]
MTSRNPRSLLRALAACLLSTALAAPLAQAADKVELTLYNGQHKEIGEAIAKAYEAKTGIHVNVRKGSSNQLASQVMEEGERSPADLIYTEESPPLNNLGEKGFLAKTDDSTLNMLPPEYVAKDGSWIGVTARVRVVAYNPKLIDEKDLPETVLEFAEPQWQGKVGFVPTSGAFQEQAVAIIKLHGREAAEEWLTGLRAFGKTYTNNMVALKAVENGEIATVLVNNYYWFALQREKGQLDSKLHYFSNGDAGGLITISSAAVLKSSKHPREAQALLAYMASEEGQRVITQTTAEYPLHKGMVSDRGLKPFDELQAPAITPADIGNAEDALDMERDVGLN